MRTCLVTATLVLALGACTLPAQQTMPAMPGMKMDAPAQEPIASPKPASSKPASAQPGPARAAKMPPDLTTMGTDVGDRAAKAAAASGRDSVAQQSAQAHGKPADGSDAESIAEPMQQMQEPEASGFRTGSPLDAQDLPSADLLREVNAQEPLTLESWLALAAEHNPTLVEAQRAIDRAQAQARQAGLPPDPTIGYSGDHIRGGSYHGGEEGAFISQDFVLGRKLALRRDVYRAQGRANELALEVQQARVRGEVGGAFYAALAAQAAVEIRDRLLKVALDAATNAHELERVGQADAPAVLLAEVAAEQAQIDFVTAQRMYLSSLSHLAAVAGQPHGTLHPLAGALDESPAIDAEALVARDTQGSPEVRRAQAEVALAEARVAAARREGVPDLAVKAGEWYSGETLGATDARAGFESFTEAGLNLPLWNRNQGNVEAARAELDRAHNEVSRTQLATHARAEPLAQQYLAAHFAAERYRTGMLPRARRAYQLQVMKYQQMAQSYPPVLAAQTMLFTLQLGYVRSLNEEWQAAIALENYTLTDALSPVERTGSESTNINLPDGRGSE